MNHSETIGKLAAALTAVQGCLESPEKNAQNYFGKMYANLETLWNAARPLLAENGLAVVQGNRVPEVDLAKAGLIVVTTIIHSSGEWIESEMFIPAHQKEKKNWKKQGRNAREERENPEEEEQSAAKGPPDAQAFGAANSYARRIAFQAALGMTPAEDDEPGDDRRGSNSRGNTAPMSLDVAKADMAIFKTPQDAVAWNNKWGREISASPDAREIRKLFSQVLEQLKKQGGK